MKQYLRNRLRTALRISLLKITSTQILGTFHACENSVYQAAFPSPARPGYEATREGSY